MPLAADTRLDAYEIVALLGAAGIGEVYRVRDATLKRKVAMHRFERGVTRTINRAIIDWKKRSHSFRTTPPTQRSAFT